MTSTWSSLCLPHISKHLSDAFRKSASFVISTSASLINIYYVLSPGEILSTPVASVYQQMVEQMQDVITPNTALLYPLPRKQFLAESWVTSGKLLVILESSILGEGILKLDFQKDFEIVSKYLANGGRVLLFLNTFGVCSQSSQSLAHYAKSTNDCVLSLPKGNDLSWTWMYKNSVLVGGYHLKEEISNLNEVNECQPTVAVLTTDCLRSSSNNLKSALNLLGIQCVSIVNGRKDKGERLLPTAHVPSENILYSFSTDSSKLKIVEFLTDECVKRNYKEEIVHCSNVSHLPAGFNWTDYFSNLHTEHLGRLVIWAYSIPSSWEFCQRFFEKIPPNSGLLVCSDIQTNGKGRGENKWISPVGQAAFTFHLTLSNFIDRMFMNYVTCMQHIIALSIVLACRHLIAEHLEKISCETKFSDISEEFLVNLQYNGPKILVKWPNDIYVVEDYDDNGEDTNLKPFQFNIIGKLAGVLVRCHLVDSNHAEFLIGCGINAFNEMPTICLEQILAHSHPCNAKPKFTTAKLISLVVSYMERIMTKIHNSDETYNLQWALRLYTRCWIHTNQKVGLQVNSTVSTNNAGDLSEDNYRIVGLDAYGYLLIEDTRTGVEHSLHPDGNSMDMMRGLIIAK
nr:unnamed protein product [Trichobilharzia regenti]